MAPLLSFRAALCVLLIFGGLGAASLYDVVDGPGTAREEREAPTPTWPNHLGQVPRFIADTRYHIQQRYALKDAFISANAAAKLALFQRSDIPNVALGQEGFLFLNTDQTIRLVQGHDRLTDTEKIAWGGGIQTLADAADKNDLPFIFVMAPNKHALYTEALPDWVVASPSDQTRSQDILGVASTYLTSAPDALTVLRSYKETYPEQLLYHRTDTHWNEAGASIVLKGALQNYIAGADMGIQFETEKAVRSGDLARMMGLQHAMVEITPVLQQADVWKCQETDGTEVEIETIDPLLPELFTCVNPIAPPQTIVAFIDSFGVPAIPYLAANFQRVEFIWQDRVDFDRANELNADLVLQVIVERKFQDMSASEFYIDGDTN